MIFVYLTLRLTSSQSPTAAIRQAVTANMIHNHRSPEKVHDGVVEPSKYSLNEPLLHQPDLLALVASVVGLTYPVEPRVPLAMVGLAVAAVQDQHVPPLEQAAELVNQEHLQVTENPQKQVLLRTEQVVDYSCVPEEYIIGQGQNLGVCCLEGVGEDRIQEVNKREPKYLNQQPEYLVVLIHTDQLVEVQLWHTNTALKTVLLPHLLEPHAVWTNLPQWRKLRRLQQTYQAASNRTFRNCCPGTSIQAKVQNEDRSQEELDLVLISDKGRQSRCIVEYKQVPQQQSDRQDCRGQQAILLVNSGDQSQYALAVRLLGQAVQVYRSRSLSQVLSNVVTIILDSPLQGRHVLAITLPRKVSSQLMQNLELPCTIVNGAGVSSLRIEVLVVKTEQEASLSPQTNSLQKRSVPEVIAVIADVILKAPVCGRHIVSRNRLVQGCPIIDIFRELDVPACEEMSERNVHSAQS